MDGTSSVLEILKVEGPLSSCRGTSVANCPDGYKIVSGGHRFGATCGCDEDYRFIINSSQRGTNGWGVKAECGTSRAIAMCIKE